MLEPTSEDRFPKANVALAVLQGEQALTRYSARPRRPKNSSIILTKSEGQLVVEIPPGQLRSNYTLLFAVLLLLGNSILLLMLFAILESSSFSGLLPSFLFLIFLWISRQLKMPLQKSLTIFISLLLFLTLLSFMTSGLLPLMLWIMLGLIPIPNLLVSFLFFAFLGIYTPFGLRILDAFILSPISRTRLTIDQQYFSLQRWWLDSYLQNVTGCTLDINRVELRGIKPITVCMLKRGLRKHYFGSFLTQPEKEWLLWEIGAFLEKGREHRA